MNTQATMCFKQLSRSILLASLMLLMTLTISQLAFAESYRLPKDALAIVSIESPKVGSLMQLSGIAGKGDLIRRKSKSRCAKTSIKLAAGGFTGEGISVQKAEPILLAIYSEQAMIKLASSKEVISTDYWISEHGEPHGDIEILQGLSPNYGFVLNPDEWWIFNVCRKRQLEVDCS